MPWLRRRSPPNFDEALLGGEVSATYIQSHVAGSFASTPRGVILHGSRSGADQPTHDEFAGTAAWAASNPDGLGWNATIGDDEVCEHMQPWEWGYNARAASDNYLAVEFAQPTVNHAISDQQVNAFCWWLQNKVWPVHGHITNFPTHAEVEDAGETGVQDGKTDVFPTGDWRAEDLRARILARLA